MSAVVSDTGAAIHSAAESKSAPTLLQHFDLLATAPGGVTKLRELILTLAVQGKLVPQDPADEPASELLKKIRAEKDRLIAEGKIKRDKPLAAIAEEEKPFELPQGWEFCRVQNLLISIRSGGTPSKQNPAFWGGGIPWASVKDLRFGDPIKNTQDQITQAGLDAGSELAPTGSILICTRMGLGKIGETLIDVAINQDLKAVLLGPSVDKQYFINYYKTLVLVGSGMTVAGIKQEELLGFVVPLPPAAEQSRIVARVEELMRLCDALEAKGKLDATQHAQLLNTLLGQLHASATPEELAADWQRVAQHFDLLLDRPEAVDALEQTLLQLAVRGLLVPQDPSDEPASALLQRIRAEKDRLIAEGKIKRDKPLPSITEEEKPFGLPMGWEWVQLGEITNYGSPAKASTLQPDTWVLDMEDIEKSSGRLLQKMRFFERPATSDKNCFSTNDVLYGKLRPYLNKVLVADEDGVCTTEIVPFHCYSDYVPQYFRLALSSPFFLEYVNARSYGMKMPRLGTEDARKSVIPLPPLPEQSRIVTRVAELRCLCANLRQRLAERQSVQAHLAGALVASVA